MKQVFFRQGDVIVDEVPAPVAERGCVLVRTAFSCLSPGTELAGVRASGKSLLARVLTEPETVRRAVDMVRTRGLRAVLRTARTRLDAARPTGYSASGTVLAVGEGIVDLRVGDRVACAGSEHAFHAEVLCVPRNLCVAVPAALGLDAAATVTLGAIALQGIRRLEPSLGETVAVIGLGLIGQLTVQVLRANGCRVVALDVDPARVALAREAGASFGLSADDAATLEQIARVTDGHGVDGAIITAASESDEIVSLAFRMCRKKGRVVLVGDVGLDLSRADLYEKELDFRVSTSYGPGRYDRRYEEDGLDYPIGYVRWTENRNMAEYLALLEDGKVRVAPLVPERHGVDAAAQAYAALSGKADRPLGVLLVFSGVDRAPEVRVVPVAGARAAPDGRLRIGILGAGSFARAAHVPALRALRARFAIHAVATRTGHTAMDAARECGAAYGTTDVQALLDDAEVDAVLIATRHDSHAELALRALNAGKHVLVEKPLALTRAELANIVAFYGARSAGAPVLLTGFNRRFSRYAQVLRDLIADASNPVVMTYRMNAGRLPAEHWAHGPEGGGRNLGEACHVYDLFTFLTQARVRSVAAMSVAPRTAYYRADDNFNALVSFDDGSTASLTYTAMGDPAAAKEQLEVFVDGQVIRLDDYRRLETSRRTAPLHASGSQEKGLQEELEAFHAAATGKGEWPIPLWQQIQATEIAFDVQARLFGTGDVATDKNDDLTEQ